MTVLVTINGGGDKIRLTTVTWLRISYIKNAWFSVNLLRPSPGTPILRVAHRRSPEDTYPTTLTNPAESCLRIYANIPAAIQDQERFQCARPYGLTPKIAPARQMWRLTEVWRSRDALWEVTGSHVFNKITTETLTARNNFQSVFSTKVYIFLKWNLTAGFIRGQIYTVTIFWGQIQVNYVILAFCWIR